MIDTSFGMLVIISTGALTGDSLNYGTAWPPRVRSFDIIEAPRIDRDPIRDFIVCAAKQSMAPLDFSIRPMRPVHRKAVCQPGLARPPVLRLAARQSVPSRTRRKRRVWEK